MAINEACSLWIEQRIQEELEDNHDQKKSLRAIGRELAKEIEKVFEAKVKPETITMKASRMQTVTNVTPSPKPTEQPEIKEEKSAPLCIKCATRKVKLSGRGNPPLHGLCRVCRKEIQNSECEEEAKPEIKTEKKEVKTKPVVNYDNPQQGDVAVRYARMAICQLESIQSTHYDRDKAFDLVIEWINKNR